MKEVIGLLIFIVIATITIFLVVDKRIGSTLTIILLVFSVISGLAAANYDIIKKLKWKDFELELEAVKSDIKDLRIQIQQSLTLKQQISTTVNNIMKVEKEIANIKEAIHQHYSAFKTELFKKEDLGKKMMVFPNPANPNNSSLIYFELEDIPENNSVIVSCQTGVAPSSVYDVNANIITLKHDVREKNFMKDNNAFYEIKYVPTFTVNKNLYSVKDMKFQPLEEGEFHAEHPLKENKN